MYMRQPDTTKVNYIKKHIKLINWIYIYIFLKLTDQRSSYLSYFVTFLFDVRLWRLTITDAHHFGHGDGWQGFRPRILLFQVLHYFILLRLNLSLQLLTGLSQLLLCLLQCSLMVCPNLVPQALLLLPVGGRKKGRRLVFFLVFFLCVDPH